MRTTAKTVKSTKSIEAELTAQFGEEAKTIFSKIDPMCKKGMNPSEIEEVLTQEIASCVHAALKLLGNMPT